MRILVTGARGFVGAEVVKQLLDHEHHVIAVDRTPAANGFRASERGPGRLSVEVVDLADGARVHALLTPIDPRRRFIWRGMRSQATISFPARTSSPCP